MEKLDKVIAGLSYCCEPNNICEDGCPYLGQREGDKRCLDFLMEDALEWLKEQNRLIRELSDNIPCCDNCDGKTVLGERTDKCVYEIEGLDSVLYCAKRGIENCFGYRKKIEELEAKLKEAEPVIHGQMRVEIVTDDFVNKELAQNSGWYRKRYYCPSCGKKLKDETYEKDYCYMDWNVVWGGDKLRYCPFCGTRIDEEVENG